MPSIKAKPTDPLKQLRQKVQVLRRQIPDLADDEGVWRDWLALHCGGERSTRAMNERKLREAVQHLHRLGARKSPPKSRYSDAPQHSKARAIWVALADAGVVKDRTGKALDAYIRRQCAQQDLGRVDNAGWTAVIQGLTAWAERKGVELSP